MMYIIGMLLRETCNCLLNNILDKLYNCNVYELNGNCFSVRKQVDTNVVLSVLFMERKMFNDVYVDCIFRRKAVYIDYNIDKMKIIIQIKFFTVPLMRY